MKGFYTRYNIRVLLVTIIIQILVHKSFYELLVCVCVCVCEWTFKLKVKKNMLNLLLEFVSSTIVGEVVKSTLDTIEKSEQLI